MVKPWWTKLLIPFSALFWLFRQLEQSMYLLRELLWNYPDTLFFGRESVRARAQIIYSVFRPHSHFALGAVLILFVLLFAFTISRIHANKTLVEGVVVGTTASGQLQTPSYINPLVPAATQLERDINELIYQPLIRYQSDGTVETVLAQRVLRFEEGSRYGFDLNTNVKWHDGTNFSIDDVFATLQLLRNLDVDKFDSLALQVVRQVAWERSGQNSLLVCTLPAENLEQFARGEFSRPCSTQVDNRPVFANFLEVLSVKIMPARFLQGLNTNNINTSSPFINRNPIGTGPYKYAGAIDGVYTLTRNNSYHDGLPSIEAIKFRLYANEESAIQALENGEIHSFASFSASGIGELDDFPSIKHELSPVIQNQYWAIYINLRDQGAPAYLRDANVRKALSLATDRALILANLYNVGRAAQGPIPRDTIYNEAALDWAEHNVDQSRQLLTQNGWTPGEDGILMKDGQRLEIQLSYVATADRQKVVESLAESWAEVGIQLVAKQLTDRASVSAAVDEKKFVTFLFAVQTYLDPDRYELFHSSQLDGLNLSGYTGSRTRKAIRDRQTIDIPEVDFLLESARGLNPQEAQQKRVDLYKEFQRLLYDDMPVIFLYRPQFVYYTQRRVSNIEFDKALNLEQRFLQIGDWVI